MLPADHLLADLTEAVAVTARQPIAELLLQRGILRQTASDLLLQRLRDTVSFTPEEEPLVLTRLWDGVPGDPPASLQGDWIAGIRSGCRNGLRPPTKNASSPTSSSAAPISSRWSTA